MRAGTTALARQLGEHPDVFMARQKEVHFFDQHYGRGLAWYERHFVEADGAAAIGEATQSYLYDELALQRIAAVLPDIRMIALLRDPVDRAYSHYWLNRSLGMETASFEEAVADEERRLREHPDKRNAFSYLSRGRYVEQLSRIRWVLPEAALQVLFFEELRDTPLELFRTACEFLEIDPSFAPRTLGRRVNGQVRFRSARVRRRVKEGPYWLRRIVATINTRQASYPPIDDVTRRRLNAYFAAEREALGRLLGRDLPHWGEP
jgi:hypothetical protein